MTRSHGFAGSRRELGDQPRGPEVSHVESETRDGGGHTSSASVRFKPRCNGSGTMVTLAKRAEEHWLVSTSGHYLGVFQEGSRQ